ncbi:hypothetical protein IMAU30038_01787 [Lactobacillus helveticus]|nr:hypothetical protein [Lactobacillus helveticus]
MRKIYLHKRFDSFVNAKTYSNSQLRKYAIKTMNKHYLLGTIEIVKDGHRQTVNVGYGYYR